MEQETIFIQYEQLAAQHAEFVASGNYKKANSAADQLYVLNSELAKNYPSTKSIVQKLVKSRHPNTFLWISVVAIEGGYRKNYILRRMKKISKQKKLGVIAFSAEMGLETYFEKLKN